MINTPMNIRSIALPGEIKYIDIKNRKVYGTSPELDKEMYAKLKSLWKNSHDLWTYPFPVSQYPFMETDWEYLQWRSKCPT